MLKSVFRIAGVAAFVCFVFSAASSMAKSPATVIKPKRSAEVAGLHEFIGKLSMSGYPVVLVRSENDHQWWVQPQPEVDQRGFFRTAVTFGNKNTPEETKFHLVVVVVETLEQSTALVELMTVEEIPLHVHRSVEQVYTYRPNTRQEKREGVLSSLQAGQAVQRRVEFTGLWQDEDSVPMIAVRTEETAGAWWIQAHPEVSNSGELSGVAHFGNDQTPAGTTFRVAVFAIETAKERQDFIPGTVSDSLPDDGALVESFVVVSAGGAEVDAPAIPGESQSVETKPVMKGASVRLGSGN